MSEEKNEKSKEQPAKKEEKAEDEAPAVKPGEFGKLLAKKKIAVTHLGDDATGIETIQVEREDAVKAAEVLRDDGEFNLMLSVTGVDMKEHRESVYHLYSTESHKFLSLKIQADANDHSPSLMPVWHACDWHERESYDLLGITYDGHPDLRRILMPIDWIGHPLRKDYKVEDPRLVWNQR